MSKESNTNQIKQACNLLQDIGDHLEQISDWCSNNAANALNNLHGQWANLLDIADNDDFIIQSSNILRDCEAFRNQIDLRNSCFSDIFKNRKELIKQLVGNDTDANAWMSQLLQLWNETILPQLHFLYEKLEEFEENITLQCSIRMTTKLDKS